MAKRHLEAEGLLVIDNAWNQARWEGQGPVGKSGSRHYRRMYHHRGCEDVMVASMMQHIQPNFPVEGGRKLPCVLGSCQGGQPKLNFYKCTLGSC